MCLIGTYLCIRSLNLERDTHHPIQLGSARTELLAQIGRCVQSTVDS